MDRYFHNCQCGQAIVGEGGHQGAAELPGRLQPVAGFLDDLTFHDLRHEGTGRLAEKLAMHELM
ncbi:MAG: hypothetical protein ACYCY5_13110 [Sulfuricella sp.]